MVGLTCCGDGSGEISNAVSVAMSQLAQQSLHNSHTLTVARRDCDVETAAVASTQCCN